MRIAISLTVGAALLAGAQLAHATPEQDKAAFQAYFAKRFPSVPFNDYVNGVYSLDKGSREQWEEIEEFPPYELDLSEGETLFNTPFKNGKSYADCFENSSIGIRQNYPYFDTKAGKVKTLEMEINECLKPMVRSPTSGSAARSHPFPRTWRRPLAAKP